MSKQEDTPDIRIIKKATCDTTSQKSKLEYHIGCTPESEIYIKVYNSSGGGIVNQEWVSLKDIQDILGKVPKGKVISSYVFHGLFKGRSANNFSFLAAALRNEKLLRLMKGKKRGHIVVDPDAFMARMEKLATTSGAKPKSTPRKTSKASTKKAAVKKRAATKRKKAPTRSKTTSS